MALKPKKKRQFILSAGDDGAILVYMEGKKVLRRLFAPSPAPEDVRHFDSLFQSDQTAGVWLLMDNMDQTYVQHTLPPVSALSIHKIIKRRLERDFMPTDIKGALAQGRSRQGRKEWHYMFISVANTPPMSLWLEYCLDRPNPLMGIHLLPVEAESFAERIDVFSHGKRKKPLITTSKKTEAVEPADPTARWHVLVSHNKIGGFRQIVLKDGKLVFTRMAVPIGEPTPEVIAGNIEQELSNTLEYMKRLGFNAVEGLNITVIVAGEIRPHLALDNRGARRLLIKTPHEIAKMLGIENATEDGDHFGDIVFATCFAISRKRLRFSTPDIDKVFQLNSIQLGAKLAAYVVAPASALAILVMGVQIVILQRDISFAEKKQAEVQARQTEMEQQMNNFPAPVEEVGDVMKINDFLAKNTYHPLKMLASFAEALEADSLLREMKWAAPNQAFPGSSPGGKFPVMASFIVQYPVELSTSGQLLSHIEAFYRKLSGFFPEYTVNFTDVPGVVAANQSLQVNFAQKEVTTTTTEDVTVTFTIDGPKADNPATEGVPPS